MNDKETGAAGMDEAAADLAPARGGRPAGTPTTRKARKSAMRKRIAERTSRDMPHEGGSFVRAKDGTLKKAEA